MGVSQQRHDLGQCVTGGNTFSSDREDENVDYFNLFYSRLLLRLSVD